MSPDSVCNISAGPARHETKPQYHCHDIVAYHCRDKNILLLSCLCKIRTVCFLLCTYLLAYSQKSTQIFFWDFQYYSSRNHNRKHRNKPLRRNINYSKCMHLVPTFSRVYRIRLKQGLKCMHLVCVSSQQLVSMLSIVVPTNTGNSIFCQIRHLQGRHQKCLIFQWNISCILYATKIYYLDHIFR